MSFASKSKEVEILSKRRTSRPDTAPLPQDCTYAQKRTIRKKAGKFVVHDGELFFKKKKKGKVWTV